MDLPKKKKKKKGYIFWLFCQSLRKFYQIQNSVPADIYINELMIPPFPDFYLFEFFFKKKKKNLFFFFSLQDNWQMVSIDTLIYNYLVSSGYRRVCTFISQCCIRVFFFFFNLLVTVYFYFILPRHKGTDNFVDVQPFGISTCLLTINHICACVCDIDSLYI